MDALNLEAQIFGKLDMATDVKGVAVAPYVSDKVKKNVKAFCKKHLIGYVSGAEDVLVYVRHERRRRSHVGG